MSKTVSPNQLDSHILTNLRDMVNHEIQLQGVTNAWIAERANMRSDNLNKMLKGKSAGTFGGWSNVLKALGVKLEMKLVVIYNEE